jgi:hypothetical protein
MGDLNEKEWETFLRTEHSGEEFTEQELRAMTSAFVAEA